MLLFTQRELLTHRVALRDHGTGVTVHFGARSMILTTFVLLSPHVQPLSPGDPEG
jgi:hypothetical protein